VINVCVSRHKVKRFSTKVENKDLKKEQSMDFIKIYFYADMDAWLVFIDQNWSRVFNAGYLHPRDAEAGDCPGWFVRLQPV
jgi:hypothetical protein